MKRLILALTLVCSVLALSTQALAQATKTPVWSRADEEFLLQGFGIRDQASGRWNFDVGAGWLHYVSDATELGAVVSLLSQDGTTGQGAGPIYRFNWAPLRKGNIFAGGKILALAGGISDAAGAAAQAEVGYRLHVGQSGGVLAAINFQRAVAPREGGGDAVNQIGFTVGFSIGKKPTTPIL